MFQALKFVTTSPELAEQIRTQPSSRAARAEAGFHRAQQRADWFEVNIEVMDMVLHAKFTQHDDLRAKLLGTGDRELIEDSPVGVERFLDADIGQLTRDRTTCFGASEEVAKAVTSSGKR